MFILFNSFSVDTILTECSLFILIQFLFLLLIVLRLTIQAKGFYDIFRFILVVSLFIVLAVFSAVIFVL